MNLPRRAAVFAFAAVLLLSLAPGLGAQQKENETFGIAPSPNEVGGQARGSYEIPLESGSTWEDALRVYNRTNETITLVIYATDAEDTENVIETGLRTSRPKGVGAWIDLARSSIELKPRDEQIVTFRVEVTDSDPSPDLGAIVVENTASGTARNAAQREHLLIRTIPPNTETTSMRVRPLLLRSPWIIVAMLGLVVAIGLVWVGARRANRPKDVVVPADEFDSDDEDDVQEASRPVIKRLGAGAKSTAVLERHAPRSPDDRPLLDDALLVEVDPDEEEDVDGNEDDDENVDDVSASDDDFDEDEDLDDDEEDLPPARQAQRPRASTSRASTNGQRKAAAKKKKPAARRKPAARKPVTRKATPKKKVASKQPAPKRGYIPLNDL